MSKKRGLGAMRGLGTLLNSSKVGRQVVEVIDDAKAIMPHHVNESVVDESMTSGLSADESPIDETVISKTAQEAKIIDDDHIDQPSPMQHTNPSNPDQASIARQDAAGRDADTDADIIDGTINDQPASDAAISDQAVDDVLMNEEDTAQSDEALARVDLQANLDADPQATDADAANDALSVLAEHQRREILLFWQHGLSMIE